MKLVWFRNDLRTGDHHALYHACQDNRGEGVLAVAALTPHQWILQDEAKSRVQFWLANLASLKTELQALNIPLLILQVESNQQLPAEMLALAQEHKVTGLYFNREYPEYERIRDRSVKQLFEKQSIPCLSYESDLIIAPGTVLNKQGGAYKVFTPFSRAWRQQFLTQLPQPLPVPEVQNLVTVNSSLIPKSIPYELRSGADWSERLWPAGSEAAHQRLYRFIGSAVKSYSVERDLPACTATSSLSPYLSQGVITARQSITALNSFSDDPDWFESQWVTELIWREFYRHLLVQYPEMNRWRPFKPEVEKRLEWSQDEKLFLAWSRGETGFAIVDAGMKQLLQTGWMHNRLRMITASFLTKILRQDWRLGARFFMQHLIDGDFASNIGGWQWSASVGADAAPYFRIFNPTRQAERFDNRGEYIARWLPELAGLSATEQHNLKVLQQRGGLLPIVDYQQERQHSLAIYNRGKG